jgi:hypothetical protein
MAPFEPHSNFIMSLLDSDIQTPTHKIQEFYPTVKLIVPRKTQPTYLFQILSQHTLKKISTWNILSTGDKEKISKNHLSAIPGVVVLILTGAHAEE